MKKSLLFSVVLLLSVALFTSCLKDDNNNSSSTQGLSKEQIHNCFLQMAGEHSGEMYFLKYGNSNIMVADTIDMDWTVVSDSVITIHNVPIKVLGALTENAGLRAAFEKEQYADIKVYYLPTSVSPLNFTVYPNAVKCDIFYNQKTHPVTFGFAINTYSWGSYENKKTRMQLVLEGIYMDDSSFNYLATQAPLVVADKADK